MLDGRGNNIILLEFPNDGKGATFARLTYNNSEVDLRTPAIAGTSSDERRRILIIDDEPDISLALESVLEGSGFRVDSFNDPLLALKNFKASVYFLFILDSKMPKMNGFELYLEIKKIDNKVKVCFLTALSEFQDYQAFKKEVSPKE
jgi:CheY-like chemotaxis protein